MRLSSVKGTPIKEPEAAALSTLIFLKRKGLEVRHD